MGNGDDQTAALARWAAAALCLVAGILVLSILSGFEGDDWSGKMISAAIVFVPFSLAGLAGVHLIERRPEWIAFGLATALLSAVAYFVVLDAFWSNGLQARHVTAEALAILAFAAGQASMLLSSWQEDDSPLVGQVILGSLAVLGLLGVLTIVEVSDPGSDVSVELFAVLSVLYLLCALLPPLLRRAELDD